MAISKRKDRQGRHVGYQVTVNVPDPKTGKTVRRVVGSYTRRKDADAAERTAKVAIQNGTFQLHPPEPSRVLTVAEAVAVWFETKRQSIQPNSATGYESAIRLHVVPALGTVPVAELTHDDVQRQVNRWSTGGMGARLLHLCLMVLRAALARQVKYGEIPANVAEGIEKPSARTRKEFMIWTDKQVGTFLAGAETDRLAALWYLTLIEGMRRSEALGLRWRDLHWSEDDARCVATINQTVVPDLANGGAALIQPRAKTRGSRRAVMLTAPTIAVLKTHRDRQRFERQNLADVWSADDLIITTTVGSVVNPTTVKRSLANLIEKNSLPSVSTHGLRHMAVTAMLRAGVSPAIVAQKVGHADIGTTVDRYGHLAASDQVTANTALEAAIGRARGIG